MSMEYAELDDTSPHRQLDKLYLQVLHKGFPRISLDQRARLKTVLGSVALLFDPLGPEHLEALLGLTERTVRLTLLGLNSIMTVPDISDGSVRLIHPSSHDFLVDSSRCDDVNFVVDAHIQHTLLAERCLRVLQALSPDMCEIGNPSLYNQEIADLPNQINSHIPAHVQYACLYWSSHLANGGVHNHMLSLLLEFCSTQLLNWLEVMSLFVRTDYFSFI
jgi:hypothetical protein